MSAEKNDLQVIETKEETAAENNAYFLKFAKPYTFEGKEYEGIDLSGLSSLTVQDAIDAQKQLFNEGEVATAMVSETTTAFARAIVTKATGLPVEFFKFAPRSISRRLTATVQGYLNEGAGETKDHIMQLSEPKVWEGKEIKEIDLNALADLTGMNESEAENRLARAGFMITETSFNYLYACILASMATGLDEKFFTSLPIRETLKLKNAVNDQSFFE